MFDHTPSQAGLPLSGFRGIDYSTGITGPYCTKVLADAGVEILKVEPTGGDPLRRYRAGGAVPEDADGALFQYLNGGKSSTIAPLESPAVDRLLAGAHLLVCDDTDASAVTRIRTSHPHLVVITLSPFGSVGPWADRPATEFTLQALAGSTAARGTADRPPLHAGGRIGEWVGGIVGAVAAAAALRVLERDGAGDHVDVSVLEAMTMMMGGYQSLLATLQAAPPPDPRRLVELPSIEPTADGYVGFCTITAQQFQDFLILIEQPELLADEDLARAPARQARREEFTALVHAWTTTRSTTEIIDAASDLRIPVSPIGTPHTITDLEHFERRGVFVEQPGGGFRRPRTPYRIDGSGPEPRPAPALGGAEPPVDWPALPVAEPPPTTPALPLEGVRVIDLTAFWAGPSATHVLACLGADVIKVESPRRPDGMRMVTTKTVDDPSWWEWSSIFQTVNVNKRAITLDLGTDRGRGVLHDLVRDADVVIENFSPRVMDEFGLGHEALLEVNSQVIATRMPAFGLDGPWRDRVGFAQTMEQVSGLAWMTGWPDEAPMIPRGVCDPIAGMHAAFAVIAALRERDRRGRGFLLECAMVEAVLNVAAEPLIEKEAYGTALQRDGNRGPLAAPQGVYPCHGHERWIAIAVENDAQWQALASMMDIGEPDPTWDTLDGRRTHADDVDRTVARWTSHCDRDELVERLVTAGIPAAAVVEPENVLELDQLRATGFIEQVEHPLIGPMELLGMPFRFASRHGKGWIRRAAPMLGADNVEVLSSQGFDAATIAELEAEGVIAEELLA